MECRFMYMSNLAKYNDGVTFIAIFIDIFSRYPYVEPMKSKSTKETLSAIKNYLQKVNNNPKCSDQMQVRNLLEKT